MTFPNATLAAVGAVFALWVLIGADDGEAVRGAVGGVVAVIALLSLGL